MSNKRNNAFILTEFAALLILPKLKYLLVVMFLVLLGSVGLSAEEASTENETESAPTFDTYRVISQRNMFSRDRRPPRTQRQRPTRRVSRVLSLYVLKGIAINGPQKIAFIEEVMSGESLKGQIGTEVLNSKISDIQYSHVSFEDNGQVRQIKIGETIGETETVSEVSADSDESTSTEVESNTEETSSDDNDILKKLLERRQSEIGT